MKHAKKRGGGGRNGYIFSGGKLTSNTRMRLRITVYSPLLRASSESGIS